MKFLTYSNQLISAFQERRPLRTKSLLMTIYGDFIEPHGGNIWLGSLIKLVAPLGTNDRLVRTSIFRLAKEEWLEAEQVGRRSYYSLTESGRRQFENADRRIYSTPNHTWDGEWRLVFTSVSKIDNELKERVKRELLWQGFGAVTSDVFAHPVAPIPPIRDMIIDLGLEKKVVVMRAKSIEDAVNPATSDLVNKCFKLQTIETQYKQFIDNFKPLLSLLDEPLEAHPEHCFLIRTLLIHDYRRILLKDPLLPAELLPHDWAGFEAHNLCQQVYKRIHQPATLHFLSHAETISGTPKATSHDYYKRFGGLNTL